MTTNTLPEPQQIASIWSELQRLNVPMKGWWAEPVGEHTGEPEYGMEVASEALVDSGADGMLFQWDQSLGWTMHDWCTPQTPSSGTIVLDIPGDPFDAPAVAEHLRKVIVGEISEFRQVKA